MDETEIIDWLCWKFAKEGERFYPPEQTAEECAEGWVETEYGKGAEFGKHSRAWTTAVEFFDDLRFRGFDPIKRAIKYEEENIRKEDYITWDWLQESHYVEGVDE